MSRVLPEVLLGILEPALACADFRRLPGRARFRRPTTHGFHEHGLTITEDGSGYRVVPLAGVRFDLVENIFHRTSGFEPEFQGGTWTVGTHFRARPRWHPLRPSHGGGNGTGAGSRAYYANSTGGFGDVLRTVRYPASRRCPSKRRAQQGLPTRWNAVAAVLKGHNRCKTVRARKLR
jgi:hypothetical protein